MSKLAKFENALSALGALCIVIMMVLTCIQVSARLGRLDIPGLYESIELFMAGTIFLGLAATQAAREHVRVDTLVNALSPRVQRWLERVVLVLSLAVIALATYVTGKDFVQAVELYEVTLGVAPLPLWPAKLAVTVGLAALAVRIAVQIGESFSAVDRNRA